MISVDVPVETLICLNDPPELKNPDDQYAPQYRFPVSGLKSKSCPYAVEFANPKSVPIVVAAAVVRFNDLNIAVADTPITTSTIYALPSQSIAIDVGEFAPVICPTCVNAPVITFIVYKYAAVPKSFELTTYQVSVSVLCAIPFTTVCPAANGPTTPMLSPLNVLKLMSHK